MARKLWVLFAYGAATYRAEHLALDLEELANEQAQSGGVVRAHEFQIEAAKNTVAKFEELLPIGTPSDFLLAGSQACWDEYERKARELAKVFRREIDSETAARLMRVGADVFLSDDSDVVPEGAGGSEDYERGETRLRAMRFDYFLAHHCHSIDWQEIDGSWI